MTLFHLRLQGGPCHVSPIGCCCVAVTAVAPDIGAVAKDVCAIGVPAPAGAIGPILLLFVTAAQACASAQGLQSAKCMATRPCAVAPVVHG